MSNVAELDHIVVNVRTEMDQAEPLFAEVGFTITPRGYHTLGSINHLMMFDTDYLELIGVPAESTSGRQDVATAAYGINGLVFKSADVDQTFEHLKAIDMAGDPPKAFSRPNAGRQVPHRHCTCRRIPRPTDLFLQARYAGARVAA